MVLAASASAFFKRPEIASALAASVRQGTCQVRGTSEAVESERIQSPRREKNEGHLRMQIQKRVHAYAHHPIRYSARKNARIPRLQLRNGRLPGRQDPDVSAAFQGVSSIGADGITLAGRRATDEAKRATRRGRSSWPHERSDQIKTIPREVLEDVRIPTNGRGPGPDVQRETPFVQRQSRRPRMLAFLIRR